MTTKIQQFQEPIIEQYIGTVAYYRKFQKIKIIERISLQYVKKLRLETQLPAEFLLGFLRDGRLRVYSPIKVKIIKEDKHIIAKAIEFNEFGFGESLSEAIIDLQRSIAELYFALEEEEHRLGHDLKRVWAKMQKMIYKR